MYVHLYLQITANNTSGAGNPSQMITLNVAGAYMCFMSVLF